MPDIPHVTTLAEAMEVLRITNCIWAINHALSTDWHYWLLSQRNEVLDALIVLREQKEA